MFTRLLDALRSIPLPAAAAAVNWIGFTPIIIAAVLEQFFGVEGAVTHWIPLLGLSFLGFAYALLLSLDSSGELFRDRPLFERWPRWLWRWACTAWGVLMLMVIFYTYIVSN